MELCVVLYMLIYFSGVMSFVYISWSFLNLLISLEMMNLALFMFFVLVYSQSMLLEVMLFMVFLVCEAIIGLSLFVLKVKFVGNNSVLSSVLDWI